MTTSKKVEEALNCGDEETRRESVESLFQASSQDALRLLIRATADESWRVRQTAVEALLTFSDPEKAITGLIHGLHSEDNVGLRNASVETLIRMGEMAVPALLDHVETPNEDVRKFVIDVLGGIADPRAVPALVAAMDDSNENVRSTAAENLGLIGSEDAVESLLACLGRGDLQLQYSSLRALASIGKPVSLDVVAPLLEKPLLTKPVYECLGNIRELPAVDLLLAGLGNKSAAIRVAAAGSLMRVFHRSEDPSFQSALIEKVRRAVAVVDVGALVEELSAPDLNRRIFIAEILGFLGDSSATLSLLEAATDESVAPYALDAVVRIGGPARETLLANFSGLEGASRAAGCAALGSLGGDAAIPVLRSSLEDESSEVKAAAAGALGEIGAIDALPGLVSLLEDASPEVEDAAVKSLVSLSRGHEREVLRVVSSRAGSDSEFARASVARILGHLGVEEGADVIQSATRDESPLVRRAALEALDQLGFARFESYFQVSLTDESAEVRNLTAELWGRSGIPRAVENLTLMLHDEDLWVRCAALRGLGECGDTNTIAVLREALSKADGILMITGLEALVRLAGEGAFDDLTRALAHGDPEVIKMSLQTLEHIGRRAGGEQLVRALIPLFEHADPDVRLATVRFAGIHQVVKTLPVLQSGLKKESDTAVREMMRYAIDRLSAGRPASD